MRAFAFGGLLVVFCLATTESRGLGQPNPIPPYKAPIATGPVVELLDENIEPLFQRLTNDTGGEAGTIAREDRDVFAGVEAARVTPMQKYATRLLGWNYRIVEKATKAREFRYLRFAWKKFGGTGIALQLHTTTNGWDQRFIGGRNVFGWQPVKAVAEDLPTEWEVVTVDLFKEFGARQVTGFSLAPLDGDSALFDHVMMGRTIEDLDKVTNAALGKDKLAKSPAGKERDALWLDLTGTDATKSATALRTFLATAPDHPAFIRERLTALPAKEDAIQVRKLIASLDAEDFDTREAAMDDLTKRGAAVIETVRDAGASASNDEVRYRCRVILKKLGADAGFDRVGKSARLSRAIRVLERAGNREAREVLTEIAERKLAPDLAPDAKAALARMPKS